jgi:hypothetical protein
MAITNNGSAQTASGGGAATDVVRYSFLAGGGENSKSGADRNGLILNYTSGKEEVFLNGVLLVRGLDYTTPDAGTIASLPILTAGDYLEIVAYTSASTTSAVSLTTFTAKGDLVVGVSSGNIGKLAVGTNGYYLKVDTTAATGLTWSAVDLTAYQTIAQEQLNILNTETAMFMGAY